jgi:hypothetical protein
MASEIIYSETHTELLPPSDQPEQLNGSERTALFTPADSENFRGRWKEIQGEFVDEPKHAVEQANELVSRVIQQLTDGFANERSKLESAWGEGKDASTEDLRQALRRYRSFFDRLLSI